MTKHRHTSLAPTFVVLGLSNVAAWLAYISAMDYYNADYRGMPVGAALPVVNLVVLLTGTVALLHGPAQRVPLRVRLVHGLGVQSACVAAVPLLDGISGRMGVGVRSALLLASVAVCSAASAASQSAVYSFASLLGQSPGGWAYVAAAETGKGIAGFVVVLVRICTKLGFESSPNQDQRLTPLAHLRHSSWAFFGCSCLLLAGSLAVAVDLVRRVEADDALDLVSDDDAEAAAEESARRHTRARASAMHERRDSGDVAGRTQSVGPAGVAATARAGAQESPSGPAEYVAEDVPDSKAQPLLGGDTPRGVTSGGSEKELRHPGYHRDDHSSFRDSDCALSQRVRKRSSSLVPDESDLPDSWSVVQDMADVGLALSWAFAVCLACFPGVCSAFESRELAAAGLESWLPVLLVLAFAIGDCVGKGLPALAEVLDRRTLWPAVCVHSLLLPVICARAVESQALPRAMYTDGAAAVLILLLGVSSGYVTTMALVLIPRTVAHRGAAAREVAGQLGVLFLIGGLCLGSVLGLILTEVLNLGSVGHG